MPITTISDTARLTAFARALESERPDALFQDPYARRLAGNPGEALAGESGVGQLMAAAVASRTAVIDELVMQKVYGEGIDLVLNLAAGLDTRPWRIDLPSDLRWLDVDLPEILSYKAGLMRGERASCVYAAVAADLRMPRALDELLEDLGAGGKTLVITEGLLVYLTQKNVQEIARALHRRTSVAWWITDFAGPRALPMMARAWGPAIPGARFQFAPADAIGFFAELGWLETEFRSSQSETQRLGRAQKASMISRLMLRLLPRQLREEIRRLSGCAVLTRVERPRLMPTCDLT